MTPPPKATVVRLADRHRDELLRTRKVAGDTIRRAVTTVPDKATIDTVADRFGRIDDALVRRTVNTTNGYLARASGIRAAADPAAVAAKVRSGVTGADSFRRAAYAAWARLGEGADYQTTLDQFVRRLVTVAVTDAQHAVSLTAGAWGEAAGVQALRYQRHTGGNPCGLCEIASTQLYRVDEFDIHENCNCTMIPLVEAGQIDQAKAENRDRLEQARARGLESNDPRVLKSLDADGAGRPHVAHHDELGPVLTVPGHNFATAGDLAA